MHQSSIKLLKIVTLAVIAAVTPGTTVRQHGLCEGFTNA
ncbi:hypothetical protein BH23CHL4_BH23CHL4_13030 [soil metagenome]